MPNRRLHSHPWHDLSLGDAYPNICNAVVEIPRGSKVKYEMHKETGMLFVNRVLYSSVVYPHEYGFLPQTLGDDSDPIDVLIMMQECTYPLAFLRVKPIGVMEMIDQGVKDDKVIAVCADDPEFKHISEISELPKHRLAEIHRFFEDYKKDENKVVSVGDFKGADEAKDVIKRAFAAYQEAYVPKVYQVGNNITVAEPPAEEPTAAEVEVQPSC